jgi:hypothetical protein
MCLLEYGSARSSLGINSTVLRWLSMSKAHASKAILDIFTLLGMSILPKSRDVFVRSYGALPTS